MAGTVTETLTPELGEGVLKISLAWVSDASGDVSGTPTSIFVKGEVRRVVTVPSGTAAPTVNYDVTILDDSGLDILAGAGADRSATVAEQALLSNTLVNDELDLVVANAGNAKEGTVHIYVR